MIREKNLDRWIFGYLQDLIRKRFAGWQESGRRKRHVLFALCDHFEPLHAGTNGKASFEVGMRRVERWHSEYPLLADQFRDSDGVAPQHTFFFPAEEYDSRFLICWMIWSGATTGKSNFTYITTMTPKNRWSEPFVPH